MLRWMLVAAAVVVLSGCSYAEKLSEIGAYVDLPRPQISGTFPMTDGMLVLRAEGVHGDFQWGVLLGPWWVVAGSPSGTRI